ncbi:hypothetical protein BEWA_050010 [Theileria equi strain WA]|uniref:Signal peptide containing protein n=1 Tax=Theileria equi strain WA TaxID=1537102 RepID=L1LBI1_THEEQ|nr:hypothetical protein BEWA_050010 [Theileria equi strain WA]EKX72533.1 hypothetical protein BEWA_050010 [Theileria equi strain WA]|eukprot:XP_004831985.1 hypothetical protein BEWA_050010 [Theileria equi strain WA]
MEDACMVDISLQHTTMGSLWVESPFFDLTGICNDFYFLVINTEISFVQGLFRKTKMNRRNRLETPKALLLLLLSAPEPTVGSPSKESSVKEALLDLSSVDKAAFNVHDLPGTPPFQLISPKEGVTVENVVDGKINVWVGNSGDKLNHARLYLKGEDPAIVFVVAQTKNGPLQRYFAKLSGNEWVDCTCTASEKLKALGPKEPQGDSPAKK